MHGLIHARLYSNRSQQKGIGGKTEPLTKAGILKHVLPNGRIVRWLCYVFDTPVGHSKQLLLREYDSYRYIATVRYRIDGTVINSTATV